MEYIGLKTDKSLVNREDAEKLFDKIRERVKAHRRKVRENVFPDLEELGFVGAPYYSFSTTTGSIVKTKSYAQPYKTHRFYLTPGNYKVGLTIKRNTGNANLKFTFTNARMTSPQSRTVIATDVLSLDFKNFEFDITVDRPGTYDFTIAITPTTEVIEISRLELLRVYQ